MHWKDVLDRIELTESWLLGIMTDNAFSNYSMPRELQSTLEASGIEWPALRYHIQCMQHVIQQALGAFISSLGVKGSTKSWKAHEHDQQFGENESINIGKSQRLRKGGNARINKVSAMTPGLARIIEKVRISRYFESPETDLHIAENACWIDYTDTWCSKWVYRLTESQSLHRGITNYGCEDTLELDTGVAWASLPNTRIHPRVAPKSKLQWLPATLCNPGWMDHCQASRGHFEAIPILDPVDIEEAYRHIASRDHSVLWHVQLYGWHYVSFG